MVQEYFAGDRKAYDEQVPVNAIASSGTSEQALFTGAGERDKESISNMAHDRRRRAQSRPWRSPS